MTEQKTGIFYFSGTGNNLYVAKKLGELLNTNDIYPFRLLEEGQICLEEYQKIIFCVPAYYSHIPSYVREVLKKVHLKPEQKIYDIVVCGGNRGRSVEDLRECVSVAGGSVTGEYMLMLPGNYILAYGALPGWVIAVENSVATQKIKRIARAITQGSGERIKKEGIFYKKSQEEQNQKVIADFQKIGAAYTVADSCIGCGNCAKVCSVLNITMVNGKPEFGKNCEQCMACIQWCPKRAIDYEMKASKRKRYHHPEITLTEMKQSNNGLKDK